ncbi:hypothetical protein [Alicyclobacillus ferrooxydans]|uniref:hypothetical protein n=1 Tax=Alicyclobacillus ferrooxydans TaxID=471514 RepID=UPI000AF79D7E|nr:hypothetical protein [Alicyclobacillus ferrooxydans]
MTQNKEDVLVHSVYPDPDDLEALRNHFLELRERCKPGMDTHEEMFAEPMGDEI